MTLIMTPFELLAPLNSSSELSGQSSLSQAQKCIVSALHARSKDEVLSVVTTAAALAVPGGHAYIAELKTQVGDR